MEESQHLNHLITQTLSRNKQAFGELYERTIQDVYTTIHFLVDEKADVDDIVQETYMQVYKNLAKFDQTRAFKPWITGIAIKQIHSYRRKKWLRLRVIKKVEVSNCVMQKTDSISEHISNKEIAEDVNHLPYKLKQVIILHYLNDLSQEEVAKVLNIPVGTVKSRIHGGLVKLRQKSQRDNNQLKEVRTL
ncbi:sigma-70 family RNA polymerase sigma factor [Bacillus alkalicellulosilyticus]|uniref:sigma-70 family RNA polymerase sigma factor n=1 Tax=Alkalihalobacterium alkalicellulosilyticum TaxID=1912214 RepID=UPI000997384C|nr:sigma-70 family RNA polymerase sigma factor [Bacillus alkalicellulosilyticus]